MFRSNTLLRIPNKSAVLTESVPAEVNDSAVPSLSLYLWGLIPGERSVSLVEHVEDISNESSEHDVEPSGS